MTKNRRRHEPDFSVVAEARRENGGVTLIHDTAEAVTGASMVYTDAWTSMDGEDETEARQRTFRPYQVNSQLLRAAGPQALLMLASPAGRRSDRRRHEFPLRDRLRAVRKSPVHAEGDFPDAIALRGVMPTAVVAIGGNSLIKPGQRGTLQEQRANLATTCEGIAAVMVAGYRVVVTHGNGPQVGDALLRSELAAEKVPPLTLDACVAETQATIGYFLQQILQETLKRRGLRRPVVTMVTQVLVSRRDPAWCNPTKPVGPFYTRKESEHHRAALGWTMVEDARRGYRRVVPSPEPKEIMELAAIQGALAYGALVIACGGGGIPVVFQRDELVGVDAVIDKDRASSLLAWELEAELFLMSTGVDQVALNYGTPQERAVTTLTVPEARRYLREGQFAAGSMGPKIEAALAYLERGGRLAIITSPERIPETLQGMAGTHITPAEASRQ